jgi:ribosomal protein S18 acetylase RimI-like enzyme
VAKTLIERGIDHAVLNVEQGNSAAIRAYQKLGFRIHAPIVDGVAVKKSQ